MAKPHLLKSVERRVVQSGAMVPATLGSRFRLVSEAPKSSVRGCVVFAPAFAEEMNKSRRMVARMARLLAADGWRVVQTDLCGCGDSSGEFRDASWATWIADLDVELAAADGFGPVWLWCMRAGSLFAPALAASRPRLNLLLWQPVMSGAQHLQQFLRLHAGARIVGAGNGSSAPSALLRSGRTVEVGGYELSPAVALGMEQAEFDLPAGFVGRVVCFEISAQEAAQPSLQATKAIDRLRERGIEVEFEALHGPSFWQTQEIEECDLLLERTFAKLGAAPAAGPVSASRSEPGG